MFTTNLRLLGTAHVATASVEAVRHQIATYQPDVVAVELCKSRYDALVSDRRLDKEGLLKVIKEGKAPMVLMQSMLSAEQRKLGINEGQQPGAELLAAVEAANEAGCEVELVDRDIQITLRRAWKRMKLREKWTLLSSLLADEEEEEDLDVNDLLQDTDLLSSMMDELKGFSPGAGEVLIDERDTYIASNLAGLGTERRVLAVLGAGHLQGVSNKLSDADGSIDSSELETFALPFARSQDLAVGVSSDHDRRARRCVFNQQGHRLGHLLHRVDGLKCRVCSPCMFAGPWSSACDFDSGLGLAHHVPESRPCSRMVCGLCPTQTCRADR